jgi:hypothetical protein
MTARNIFENYQQSLEKQATATTTVTSTLDKITNDHARNPILVSANGERKTAVDESLLALALLLPFRRPWLRCHRQI